MSKLFAGFIALMAFGALSGGCDDMTGGGGGSACEQQVDNMEADGISPASDHDFYVQLCEDME